MTNCFFKEIYNLFQNPLLNTPGGNFLIINRYIKKELIENYFLFFSLFFNKNLKIYKKINLELLISIINNNKFICILYEDEINNLPLPNKEYLLENILEIKTNSDLKINDILKILLKNGYDYSPNFNLDNSEFKNIGDIIELREFYSDDLYRIEFFGKKIEKISKISKNNKDILEILNKINIYPSQKLLDYNSDNFSESLYSYINKNNIINLENDSNIIYLDRYNQNFKKIKKDFKTFFDKNYTISLFSKNKEEIKKILFDQEIKIENINFYNYKNNEIIKSFIDKKRKIVFLSDLNLFSKNYSENKDLNLKSDFQKKIKKRKKKLKYFLQEIKYSDYVVHAEHGVAKFNGIFKKEIDDIKKDFALLEYANFDKLYVSIENLDKIDKYIGKNNPKISRLSESPIWILKRKKIKEETFLYAKELLKILAKRESRIAIPIKKKDDLEDKFENLFEYEETKDQKKTILDIYKDLEKNKPMDRLLCADVGFGKTEVAMRASFRVASNNYQVAILCPTTILSQQHYDNFVNRFSKFNLKICILNRFLEQNNKKNNVLKKIKSGYYDIIIGTHRLLSSDLEFKNLGLFIIDEEQKFGSISKEKIKNYHKNNIHLLTMTATPIPRTLNLSLSGIRDISVIETPPSGRKNIDTYVLQFNEEELKKCILKEKNRSGQCYYLFNKVEKIYYKKRELEKLLPNISFGVLHGKMSNSEISKTISKFDNKKIDVLICSTIVENGIDMPNVNTLIVENSPKFGLSQLHQIRGRIGRSNKKGYAYFFYKNKENLSETARKRLQILLEKSELGDGYKIASSDMEIRGVGNILGKSQHGNVNYIGINLYTRLLNQSINELKSGENEDDIDFKTNINLPIDYNLPENIIPLENKINIYQEMLFLNNEEEVDDYIKDKIIKNKKIDSLNLKKLNNLKYIILLKIISYNLKITDINYYKNKISIIFEDKIDKNLKDKILNNHKNFIIKDKEIKIKINNLEKNYLKNLVEILS
ncbi:DEAD/DEAH box helicase [Patescibacteria group bacterium]|nr:DEAD/DEAH box helicase [Patescibacteria group bacterium]